MKLWKVAQIYFSLMMLLGASHPILSFASPAPSAFRIPQESYLQAQKRAQSHRPARKRLRAFDGTIWEIRGPVDQMDLSAAPELPDFAALQSLFTWIRDDRSWEWNQMPGFKRRLFWVLPEDGCYVRAELMAERLKARGYPTPGQVMVFGDLSVELQYESLNWWYHVAPAYRVGGALYVVDPSIEPKGPLVLNEWIRRMNVQPEDVTGAVCAPYSNNPYEGCDLQESSWDPADRAATLQDYLGREWNGVDSPEQTLGDRPPWLASTPRFSSPARLPLLFGDRFESMIAPRHAQSLRP